MKIYKRLLKYLKKYKARLATSIFFSILYSILSGIAAYLTIPLLRTLFMNSSSPVELTQSNISNFFKSIQYHFENFIMQGGKEFAILKICIVMVIAYSLKNLTGYIHSILVLYVEKGIMRDIRNQLYEKINSFPIKYFTEQRTGHLMSIMTSDVSNVQSAIAATFYDLMKDPLLIIIYMILSFLISVEMSLIAFIVFPLSVFIISRMGASLRRRSMRVQNKISDIMSIVSETIYAAKIIRAFNAENYKNKNFRQESERHFNLTKKVYKLSELVSPLTEILTIIAGAFIVWFGGRQILINNALKPEEFFGFLFILFQMVTPIKHLGTVSNRIQESSASGERIFSILDAEVEIEDDRDAIDLEEFKNQIEVKNVSFSYDGNKEVLKNVTCIIKKSELIALVGPSGAGKTTMVDLIARFYDVSSGEILIDGINIKKIKIKSLRKLIAIVPQEIILFNDTIRNNILFGLEDVSEETLIQITKYANAYDFIMQMSEGFDTNVGERGIKLSGGQKQRIAIARALLRNPQILILDEATSSLDSESESLVQDALDKLMANRTSIVIAHRLSTILNADKILVFDEGKIIQTGKHSDLIKIKSGLYRKLYDMQFKNEIK
ncbi:MAG: ABC transporter ATP-binding protein/permease [Ignavibacteria bacterium]|nr:ABC transporter ATP-binding protein/permease [Ignavibacteria bacterium]